MQITCNPNPDRQSIVTIFCDGEPWRELHTSIFGRKPKLPKECRSIEEFSEQFSVIEYQQVKNYALRRLSLQAMLSMVLSKSLKERLIPEKVILKVIQEFTVLGYLNDEEWTASFVRSQSNRKVGPRAIAQKLASKGVKGEKLEQALQGSWDVNEQKNLIGALLKSRYAKRNLSDYKEKHKVVASLIRKGFDLSAIMACLQKRNLDEYSTYD